jgi:hypothetical protein
LEQHRVLAPVPQVTLVVSVQMQAPLWQVVPLGHTTPQAPQLLLSLPVLVQVPVQQVWPEEQQVWLAPAPQTLAASQQTPLTQVWVEVQAAPEVPHTQVPVPSVAEQVLPPGQPQVGVPR